MSEETYSSIGDPQFVVDEYADQIRVKTRLAVQRWNAERLKWGRKVSIASFDTREAANDFIRDRAINEVRAAEAALKKAIARKLKCDKKFGGVQ